MTFFVGPKQVQIDATIIAETERAILIETADVFLRECDHKYEYLVRAWIPKKCIRGQQIWDKFNPDWKFEKYI